MSFSADPTQKGWLTSILELGAWFGTLCAGFLAEILSRKYAIILETGIFIIGVVIQTTAVSAGPSSILAGRFITGIGVGSLSMIVPMVSGRKFAISRNSGLILCSTLLNVLRPKFVVY